MIPSLPQNIQQELNQLARNYGQPLVPTVELTANKLFDPLNKRDRFGEVCMVVRRTSGHLLTMKKTYYPPEGYRLLTGGINHGEAIYDALLRETHEETGLEVKVQRFLVAASYQVPTVSATLVFYTFAFLLDEVGGTFGVIDESEQVEGFREIEVNQLLDVAESLESLKGQYSKKIGGYWGDWGQFRAAIHRQVWEALQATQW
jgi:8-oxo-dGTP pyrophosphatase MutT (NUDIX family)